MNASESLVLCVCFVGLGGWVVGWLWSGDGDRERGNDDFNL